jgi:hypothetical protein
LSQVTTRSPARHFDASLTTRRNAFWHAVIVVASDDVAEPVASAVLPPSKTNAITPSAIVRVRTHPPLSLSQQVVTSRPATHQLSEDDRCAQMRMALRSCGELGTDP